MKSFLDLAQANDVLGRVARGTRWSLSQAKRLVDAAEQRLRSAVPPAPPPIPPLVPRLMPPQATEPLSTRVVSLSTASGRRARVAVHGDLRRLQRHVVTMDNQTHRALHEHARTIDELARRQAELQSKLDDLQAQCDLALVGGLRGSAAADARLATGEERLQTQEIALKRARVATRRALALQQSTQRAQALNAAIGSAQAAAFGERGSLFASNNLTIAAGQLVWGILDPWLRQLRWWSGSTVHPATWLGPLLGGAMTQAVLTRYPYTDRISGVFVFPVARPVPELRDGLLEVGLARVFLQERIPSAIWEDFKRRDDVVATAVVVAEQDDDDDVGGVEARVREGMLFLRLTKRPEGPLKVVWTVDISVPHS